MIIKPEPTEITETAYNETKANESTMKRSIISNNRNSSSTATMKTRISRLTPQPDMASPAPAVDAPATPVSVPTVAVGESKSTTSTTSAPMNPAEPTKPRIKQAPTHLPRRTEELRPHPLNESIYGDGADEKLIQSIREVGIIQPLIIDNKNRVVSGHRRLEAARALKIEEMPVVVLQLENELDIETALIEANRQRVKTNEQEAREAAEVYRIEQAKARARQVNANPGGTLPAKSPEGSGDARDLAGERVGLGGKKVVQSAQVIEAIDRLEKEGEHDAAEKIRTELNKYSVNRAFTVAQEKGLIKGVTLEPPAEQDDFILIEQWKKMTPENQLKALAKHYVKTKFNSQETDGIEWAKWSWNPITGCFHGCPYCYARDIANRMFDAGFVPAFYPGRLLCPQNTKLPPEAKTDIGYKNVFVCSMSDLFGKWVPKELVEMVLAVVRQSPQWNFLFLTKYPQRLLEFEFPDNAWVGTSVDTQARVLLAEEVFEKVKAKVKWLSCEPMMERLTFEHLERFQWVVLGGSSKSTQTPEFRPPREWVSHLWAQARAAGCMIYEKPNLLERCREYPAPVTTSVVLSDVVVEGDISQPQQQVSKPTRKSSKVTVKHKQKSK